MPDRAPRVIAPRHRRPRSARYRIAACALLGGAVASCARSPEDPQRSTRLKEPLAIGPARCAANRAAGTIVFLTQFGYAAASGILDVLTADRRGYFAALCLDVAVRPGGTNAQLVSAGTAQMAGLGDAASTMVAIDHGARLVGVATYGNTSAVELVTLRSAGVPDLAALTGRVVGYKVAVAPQVIAMFANAGVPPEQIRFVSVPFNPALLVNGQVAALIGYKSNEPRVLEAAGHRVVEWDPERFGVHSTFSVIVANRKWADAHPTAVADFLRATLRAYGWITASPANLDTALGYAAARSSAGFDLAQSRARWTFEADLIRRTQPEGTRLGDNVPARWDAEARTLTLARLVRRRVGPAFDNRYVNSIYAGKEVTWPAP